MYHVISNSIIIIGHLDIHLPIPVPLDRMLAFKLFCAEKESFMASSPWWI